MMFFEDRPAASEEVEQLMLRPFRLPHLDRLRVGVLQAVLTRDTAHAAVRRVVLLASRHPTGQYVKDYLPRNTLDTGAFRDARAILEVDTLLKATYGNTLPALDELQAMGLPAVTRDYVVQVFRRDNAVERVWTTALLVFWGAQYMLDVSDPMFGTSTALARTLRTPTRPPVRSSQDHRSAAVFYGVATLEADGEVT